MFIFVPCRSKSLVGRVVLALFLLLLFVSVAFGETLPLQKIRLPKGFKIEVYAEVPKARSLTLGDEILYGEDVPRKISGQDIYRRTWFLEPFHSYWL